MKLIKMKHKVLFLLTFVFLSCFSVQAQRGVRIGYIDTEYILENVPEYQEATTQLENKAQKWKTEIDGRLSELDQKRTALSNEKALLTKELIDEREEDLYYEEKEILDYQQKRFGPNGDLFIQKKQLMQPIQDQIFAAVQDVAAGKKYDFIFDKSADVVMLYSNKAYDLSDQILRTITRSSKRRQVSSKAERKAAEEEELVPEINYELEERERALEEKKTERESAIEKRRQEILANREAKKKAAEERRQQILDERAKAREDKLQSRDENTNDDGKSATEKSSIQTTKDSTTVETPKTREQLIEENRQKKLADREKRKKELEERKKKILEERQKAIEERQKAKDSLNNN